VLEITAQPVRRKTSEGTRAWRLVLTTFEHGRQTIPPITIEGKLAGGRTFSTASHGSLDVVIAPPQAASTDELRPLTTVLEVPAPWFPRAVAVFRRVALVIAAALIALVFGSRFIRWRRRRLFWRRLRAEATVLNRLAGRQPAREQYMKGSALLRNAVAPIAHRTLDPLTSAEVAALVGASGPIGFEIGPALTKLVSHLDAVRFGGKEPGKQTRRRAVDALSALVVVLSAIDARQSRGRLG
jgi:hypothetical protein